LWKGGSCTRAAPASRSHAAMERASLGESLKSGITGVRGYEERACAAKAALELTDPDAIDKYVFPLCKNLHNGKCHLAMRN
ncbi:MAG: hypothetical protein Q4A07_04290, partial [Coriobacteriales bacterium]|nr:hypothetical protein [Coriobacteriales bacterium]